MGKFSDNFSQDKPQRWGARKYARLFKEEFGYPNSSHKHTKNWNVKHRRILARINSSPGCPGCGGKSSCWCDRY